MPKLNKKFLKKACLLLVLVTFLLFLIFDMHQTKQALIEKYQLGIDKMEEGRYQEAIDIFTEIGDYKGSFDYIESSREAILNTAYEKAILLFDSGDYEQALKEFTQLGSYMESKVYAEKATKLIEEREEKHKLYNMANELVASGNLLEALNLYNDLGDYVDSLQLAEECHVMLDRLVLSNTVSAGIRFSLGITQESGRNVVFCGDSFGGLSDVEDWSDIISASAKGKIAIGLKKDGSVVTAGQVTGFRIDTSDWNNIIAVSAGEQFVVGLKSNGTLTAQGIDGYGETDIDSWNNIIAIDTGWQHTVGLDKDGKVWVTGIHSEKLRNDISENKSQWTDIVSISTGGSTGENSRGKGHIVALKRDGTVVAVGDNSDGQCNVDEWENVIAISAGDYHTVGLTKDGRILTTQSEEDFPDSYTQVAAWNEQGNIVAVSAGYGYTLVLFQDGTVGATGNDVQGQCDVDSWNNIASHDTEWRYIFDN